MTAWVCRGRSCHTARRRAGRRGLDQSLKLRIVIILVQINLATGIGGSWSSFAAADCWRDWDGDLEIPIVSGSFKVYVKNIPECLPDNSRGLGLELRSNWELEEVGEEEEEEGRYNRLDRQS